MKNSSTTDLAFRLGFVEMCLAEYPLAVRFEIERAMFVPGFAPGPSRTPQYRKLFEERDTLRAALGMEPAELAWPLQRKA